MAMSERSMREVHDGTSCAVAACADLIGTKWTSLIIHDLSEGAQMRYHCIRRPFANLPSTGQIDAAHARLRGELDEL